jgi:hypothetical protein
MHDEYARFVFNRHMDAILADIRTKATEWFNLSYAPHGSLVTDEDVKNYYESLSGCAKNIIDSFNELPRTEGMIFATGGSGASSGDSLF